MIRWVLRVSLSLFILVMLSACMVRLLGGAKYFRLWECVVMLVMMSMICRLNRMVVLGMRVLGFLAIRGVIMFM